MYSGLSSVIGEGSASAEQIDTWFAINGPSAARSYAPDKTYKPAPVNLGQMIIDACNHFTGVVVNWDLIAADIAKESAFWQSKIVRQKNNPSGLGATNDNPLGNAKHFSTAFEGILATVAHMLNYFLGEGPWTAYDPRTSAMRSAKYMGVAKKLSDLDGKWATPGIGYGASVGSGANRLLATEVIGDSVEAQIPGFKWEPADSNHFTKGRTKKISGGAQHYSAGTNSLAWLTKTSGQSPDSEPVSATFLVKHNPTMEDRGWQLVRIEDTPWTTWIANPYTVSIEYEHKPDVHGDVPNEAYEVLAQTWVDISNYLKEHPELGSITLDRTSIRGHKEWVGNPSLICPDGVDVDRIVARAIELADGPQEPEVETFPTGFTLHGGFLQLYKDARKGDVHWKTIGYPIGPEITNVPIAYRQEDGTVKVIESTIQETDRGGGWLLWNPETQVATMATRDEARQIEKWMGRDAPRESLSKYAEMLEQIIEAMRAA